VASTNKIKRLVQFLMTKNRLEFCSGGTLGALAEILAPGSGADALHAIATPGRCPTAAPRNASPRASYWVDPKLGFGPDFAPGAPRMPGAPPVRGPERDHLPLGA
jgi:hypothetical protein